MGYPTRHSRKRLSTLLLAVAISIVPYEMCARELRIPKVALKTENSVSREIAERVAFARARGKWGEVRGGPVIECCDLDRRLVCYAFVFAIGRSPFPGDELVLEGVMEGRMAYEDIIQEMDHDRQPMSLMQKELEAAKKKRWGIDQYGTVMVSATYDLVPIPEVIHGLHYFYSKGDLIVEKAEQILGADARLVCIHYRTPLDQGYRFTSGDREVVIDPFSLAAYREAELERRLSWREAFPVDERLRLSVSEEWRSTSRPSVDSYGEHFLDYHDGTENLLLPCYLWTCGCAPTAAAMASGYWDNYGLVDGNEHGKQTGWGRLIECYMDREAFESYRGSDSVNFRWECQGGPARPRLILDLALAMGTRGGDGATHLWDVSTGIDRVAGEMGYGQGQWSQFYIASPENDWRWELITDEIRSNHSLVWTIPGHALCAWGYGDEGAVIVYDTWDEMRHDYDYRECHSVHTVIPSGGEPGQDVELSFPDGGEEYMACEEMTVEWFQYGGLIDNVNLFWSSKGGHDTSWTALASCVPSSEGRNTHQWFVPNTESDRMRVMVQGWEGDHTYHGGDGSRGNFSVVPVTPSLEVRSPNGGECNLRGSRCEITWDACLEGDVRIELSRDSTYAATLTPRISGAGSYSWLIPPDFPSGSNYYIRIVSLDDPAVEDFSDGPFAIARTIQVESPRAGETCYIWEDYDVTWVTSEIEGEVEIDYSTDGGASWISVASHEHDDGSYIWRIPNTVSIDARLKIAHLSCPGNSDSTEGGFAIWLKGVDRYTRYPPEPPDSLCFRDNYPNPVFNRTSFDYYLPQASDIQIDLVSLNGSLVLNLAKRWDRAGWHKVDLEISEVPRNKLPDGLYLCVLQAYGVFRAKKVIVCR